MYAVGRLVSFALWFSCIGSGGDVLASKANVKYQCWYELPFKILYYDNKIIIVISSILVGRTLQ